MNGYTDTRTIPAALKTGVTQTHTLTVAGRMSSPGPHLPLAVWLALGGLVIAFVLFGLPAWRKRRGSS